MSKSLWLWTAACQASLSFTISWALLQHQSFQWIFRVGFLIGLTGLISLQSKGPSKVFSNTTVWKHQFFGTQPYLGSNSQNLSMTTGKIIALAIWAFVGKVMSLLFNVLSSFAIAFPPRSKHLLILWLQSSSAVILEPRKIKSATVSIFFPI